MKPQYHYFLVSAALFVIYVVVAKLGLSFASISPFATAVWAPTGIAIAALLLFGRNLWPAVALAAFVTNITIAGHVPTSIGIAIGNTLEAFLAAYLIERFAGGIRAFDHARSVFSFSFFAGAVGPAVSATIGTLSLALYGFLSWENYTQTWATWWIGDLTGALIVAPVIILWVLEPKIYWKKEKALEAGLLVMLLFLFVLYARISGGGFLYLLTPVFVWGAFRFGQRETATAVFGLTLLFLAETLQGAGPFVRAISGINEALILLETSMGATFITMMALTATIAEREHAEAAMKESGAKIAEERAVDAAIIASVGEGLVFVGRDEKISHMNPQAEKMLGLKPGEFVGKWYHDAFHMEDEDGNTISATDRPISQALATGKKIATEPLMPTRYYVRKDGGKFPISFVVTPVVMDGRVIGAIDVFRDVTQGKEIDRAKSDFVSLASHQLRTPLSIISMYAELLRRQGGLFEKHDERECRKYSKEIEEATRRMADLINDLLNVSRIDAQTLAVTPVRVDLKKAVASVTNALAPKVQKKRLSIAIKYRDDPPKVITDGQLIGVILQNLITNAVKYTPRGGRIKIDIGTENGQAFISVTDNGYGIPKSQQGEIFKKLFRASNVRRLDSEGSGLGLYIAKSMAERLGGTISFVSKEKKGSTFTLRLPAASSRSFSVAAKLSHA